MAQPRLTKSETKITASGVDIVVALDLSGSMRSEDFEVRGKRHASFFTDFDYQSDMQA